MTDHPVLALAISVVLLIGNAFFVASEFSLIASRRTVVEPLAAESRRARAALRAMNQIPLMVAGAQLGVTLCSLGLGALAEPGLARVLVWPFARAGVSLAAVAPFAFLLALGIVVFLHTVVGEMVPKNLTLVGPERAVVWLGGPMLAFCVATKPVLEAMKWIARQILRVWGIEAADAVKTVYTAAELANLVTQARSEGLLDPEEHARISGALALQSRTAAQAMRAWPDVTTVGEDVSPASLEVLAGRTGRSRFPVIHRDTRRVMGFVHVKDVLGVTGPARLLPIDAGTLRPLAVVAPDHTLADLLIAMRRDRRHIVLVSEGGTPLGLLTLYDVLGVIAPLPA
jgi:CBS domain containing-hemolysin-like protein